MTTADDDERVPISPAGSHVARTVMGPDMLIVIVASADVTLPVQPANRYTEPDPVTSTGALSRTVCPAGYHPVPSTVPTSELTWRKYSVRHVAFAVLGPSITMPDDVLPVPVASPVQPTIAYRTPVAPGTVVLRRLAKAVVPASYQPPPPVSP